MKPARLLRKPHIGNILLANALIWGARLIRLAILLIFLAGLYFAYRFTIHNIVNGSIIFGGLAFWALTAYITLPRLHRWLTRLYLPDYYVGRTRTADGLLGDPINLAVIGSARALRSAMEAAGWVEAETITLKSTLQIIHATIFGNSYPNAPMSPLYLFSQRQTYAFQKEISDRPGQRHHVRFWRTPRGWWLPGGHAADWLGAATFDTHVGLSIFTGQFTHRIALNIDEERDFVVESLRRATGTRVEIVPRFTVGLHSRNGGGDRMRTDGAMPFIHLEHPPRKRQLS